MWFSFQIALFVVFAIILQIVNGQHHYDNQHGGGGHYGQQGGGGFGQQGGHFGGNDYVSILFKKKKCRMFKRGDVIYVAAMK